MNKTIDRELGVDMLITCVEGGSNYWARFRDYEPDEGSVTVIDEEGNIYAVDADDFVEAVRNIEVGPGGDVASWVLAYLPDDFDSIDADCLLQYCVFGEVIYS